MSDTPTVYSQQQVSTRLREELPNWVFADDVIRREYRVSGWKGALMVVGAVGHLAEVAWHHPDLEVTWGKVVVKLSTHSAGGVTDLDFALAKRIEAFVCWRPGDESGPLPGTPEDPRHAYINGE